MLVYICLFLFESGIMYSLNSPEKKSSFWQRVATRFSFGKKAKLPSFPFDYKEVVVHLNQVICVKDEYGKYQMVNPTFCDLAGVSKEEIIGKDDSELGLFLNPEQTMLADKSVFDTGQKKHIPLEPFTDKYGSLYWFQTDKIPLQNSEGKVEKVLIISDDITNKITIEQRLLKSELRYKSIFENNYSGIILVNQQLDILNKNKAFNKLVQVDGNRLGEDDLKNYISKEDRSDLLDLMASLVTRNYEYFDLQLELNTENGETINTICFVRGLYDDNGNFTEAVVTFQDITKDVKNRKALEDSEKRFRVIVENAPEAIMLLDFDTKRYTDVNKNAEELFGFTRDELLGLELGALSPLNQGDGSNSKVASKEQMERALQGENVIYEWTVRRKDNKLIPCEVRLVKLPYQGSNIVRTSVIDITERKRAERMLNLEKQKLEEKNDELTELNNTLENQTKQLQEFAYISSHNLRSPAGNIRALLDFYRSDPTQRNLDIVVEKLDTVSVDLLDTINDLANVVKIKNEISQEKVRISLSTLIEKAKDSLSEQIKSKQATVKVSLNGIEIINASKTYMDSIALNLLSNALKYAKTDTAPVIEISASEEGAFFKLRIKDNGLGIDLNKHGKKVFGLRKTFHRNKDSRGVGLFITKAQVEAMQGSIAIESEQNIGTIFTISLPNKIIQR